MHRTIEDGVRCSLWQSGLPYAFWDKAALHWIKNYNVSTKLRGDEATPFERRYGKACDDQIVPFGALVHYHAQQPDRKSTTGKFAPRPREGIAIGYGAHNALEILDIGDFLEGRQRTLATADARLRQPHRVPHQEGLG